MKKLSKTYIAKMTKNKLNLFAGGKKYTFDVPTKSRVGVCFTTTDEQEQKDIESSPYFGRGITVYSQKEVEVENAHIQIHLDADSNKEDDTHEDVTDFDKMTVPQLKEYAVAMGCPNAEWSSLKKDELVAYLKKQGEE